MALRIDVANAEMGAQNNIAVDAEKSPPFSSYSWSTALSAVSSHASNLKKFYSRASNLQKECVSRIYGIFPSPQKGWETTVRKLEHCRKGYPRLAAFLDSDENFMIYRRFGYLQARLLLDKQNELQRIEKNLDMQDECADEEDLATGEVADENPSPRKELLKEGEAKFREYATLLAHAKETTSMRHPTASEYRSLRNYCDWERQISERDEEWVYCREDMVTLRPGRDHAWLDRAIETVLRLFNWKLMKYIFCSKETRMKCDGPPDYYTRGRIQSFAAGIITVTILLLLIVPTYVLYHLTNDMKQDSQSTALCIGVLLVFTLAFSAVLSLFTRARRHEILAAAAAYCAVLVVFLGNVPRPV